uniref:Uncharacterized protein n=1 Tax=Plectus sambesii TaxID=2011161 RepID=A0A914USK3_9BILA
MNWGERMRCQSLAVVVGVRRIGRWAICTRHACKVGREKRRWRLCAGRPKSDAPMVATELFASEPVDHWSDPTPLSSPSLSLSLSLSRSSLRRAPTSSISSQTDQLRGPPPRSSDCLRRPLPPLVTHKQRRTRTAGANCEDSGE